MRRLTVALTLASLSACIPREPAHDLAIEHVAIVNVAAGTVSVDQTVIIDGGRITALMSSGSSSRPAAATVVDARGKYVVPGLWDMHVHITDSSYLPHFIAHGVTGVRDMGGGLESPADGCESVKPSTLQSWRTKVERGELVGPHVLLSGPAVSGTGGRTSLPARTPDEAVSAIAELKAMGVDFVKVYERIPLESYLALAKAARQSGLAFAGHVPEESVSLLDAINAGQRSIEHVRAPLLMCHAPTASELSRFFADDRWSEADIEWGRRAHAQCDDVFAAARTNAVWFTPTLVVEHAKVAVDDERWIDKRADSWLPESVRDADAKYFHRKRSQTAAERASERLWWETQKRVVARLARSGASLLAGTDAGCEGGLPGEDLHSELELMVQSGLTPREALATATVEPARYLGTSDSRGVVAIGAHADLVLLDGNPLEDISHTRRIHGVVRRGAWLDDTRLVALRGSGAHLSPQRSRAP